MTTPIPRRALTLTLLAALSPSLTFAADKQRVQGIGGFFFRAKDPAKLAAWYEQHLGIDPAPTSYEGKPWRQEAGITVLAPFPQGSDYFPKAQGWMINFRVANLDAMATQLRAAGIKVEIDPMAYPNGRFAQLADPEGNPIQLWEPKEPG